MESAGQQVQPMEVAVQSAAEPTKRTDEANSASVGEKELLKKDGAEGAEGARGDEDVVTSHTAAWSAAEREAYAWREEERKRFEVISEGSKVVVRMADGRLSLVKVKTGKKAKFGRGHFKMDKLVARTYSRIMSVKRGDFSLVPKEELMDDKPLKEEKRNNEFILDETSNQKLTDKDIRNMKKEGADAKQVISGLIENSKTFKNKTQFAKAKYLKRKRKKHMDHCQIFPATALNVCEVYLKNDGKKCMYMRPDTLGTILTAANIRAHSKTMICDSTSGVVTAAVVERQGGFGRILNVFTGERPRNEAISNCNFPRRWCEELWCFPLALPQLLSREREQERQSKENNDKNDEQEQPENETVAAVEQKQTGSQTQSQTQSESQSQSQAGKASTAEADENGEKNEMSKREERRNNKRLLYEKASVALKAEPSDSLIIATRYDPLVILKDLLPYIAPCAPIVVYSECMEPLLLASYWLKSEGQAVNCHISENWLREYQILPKRTHPMMNMNGFGGYILTATKLSHFSDVRYEE